MNEPSFYRKRFCVLDFHVNCNWNSVEVGLFIALVGMKGETQCVFFHFDSRNVKYSNAEFFAGYSIHWTCPWNFMPIFPHKSIFNTFPVRFLFLHTKKNQNSLFSNQNSITSLPHSVLNYIPFSCPKCIKISKWIAMSKTLINCTH